MDSPEKIFLSLTSKEYSILSKISDWPDKIEMIIMTAEFRDDGACIISGTKKNFEELHSAISEELDIGTCKKNDRVHLIDVLEKLYSYCCDTYD